MDVNTHNGAHNAPPGEGRFQFTLKHLLAAPIWVAFFFAVVFSFGFPGFVVFLALHLFVIGIWQRSVRWFVVGAGLLLLGTLLLPAFQTVGPRRGRQCANNLKQIGLALHNYHDVYGCFPPAYVADENGRPMHSWRVLILPFLDRIDLYLQYRFDEPWDGASNRKLADVAVAVFNCPKDQATWSPMTSYVAVVGPDAAWPGSVPAKLGDITDGTSNTIPVVEVANSGIHWMEPRDLHVIQMARGINPKSGQGISSVHPGGAQVCLPDGSVWFLRETIRPEDLHALLTIAGGEPVPEY